MKTQECLLCSQRGRSRNGIIPPRRERTVGAELNPTSTCNCAQQERWESRADIWDGTQGGQSWQSHWHQNPLVLQASLDFPQQTVLLERLSCFWVQMVEIKIVVAAHSHFGGGCFQSVLSVWTLSLARQGSAPPQAQQTPPKWSLPGFAVALLSYIPLPHTGSCRTETAPENHTNICDLLKFCVKVLVQNSSSSWCCTAGE